MAIRKANRADWPRIVEIYNQAVDDGTCTADTEHISIESRRDWFTSHLEPAWPLLVIEQNGIIAGWSCLSPFRPGRKALAKTVEISYYFDREFRGQGLGKVLFEATMEHARQLGHEHLFAILLEINTVSINLLEKYDFSLWGKMPDVADFGEKRSGLLIYGRKI